jgi:hypothetical protein
MSIVYGLYRTGKEAPSYKIFASEKDAQESGNAFSIVKSQSCLSDSRLFPTGFLVEIYNLNADRKVAKFRDRATAESRVWKMLTDQKDAPITNPIKSGEKSRRVFKGQMVRVLTEHNPRRKDTWANFSWHLLKKNGPMLYEDFIAAGGRRPDFAYDVDHGWAEVCSK